MRSLSVSCRRCPHRRSLCPPPRYWSVLPAGRRPFSQAPCAARGPLATGWTPVWCLWALCFVETWHPHVSAAGLRPVSSCVRCLLCGDVVPSLVAFNYTLLLFLWYQCVLCGSVVGGGEERWINSYFNYKKCFVFLNKVQINTVRIVYFCVLKPNSN